MQESPISSGHHAARSMVMTANAMNYSMLCWLGCRSGLLPAVQSRTTFVCTDPQWFHIRGAMGIQSLNSKSQRRCSNPKSVLFQMNQPKQSESIWKVWQGLHVNTSYHTPCKLAGIYPTTHDIICQMTTWSGSQKTIIPNKSVFCWPRTVWTLAIRWPTVWLVAAVALCSPNSIFTSLQKNLHPDPDRHWGLSSMESLFS